MRGRNFLTGLVLVSLALTRPVNAALQPPDPASAAPTLEQQYLAIYLGINDAEKQLKSGDFQNAAVGFEGDYQKLTQIHDEHPDWEPVLIVSRMEDCRAKIAELLVRMESQPASYVPGPTPEQIAEFSVSPPTRAKTTHYPWKSNILASVFWIGKGFKIDGGSTASSWDQSWLSENGGTDSPATQDVYASKNHASLLNPFYVALPFNDLTYPDKARRWVPKSWTKPPRNGKPVSACQDRWIEIKSDASGRTCFAQWEDVGPVRSDHAEYVFGPERPAGHQPGMSVSPAVAKYLGINWHGDAAVSWRFVDNGDVQPGMWLKYDEQTIMFRALHQQNALTSQTPHP